MKEMKMGSAENRFAQIIWENEPIQSAELAKIAETQMGWKKTTTYTVLKRLCDKGIFKNNSGTVCSVVSQNEFLACQTEQFVTDTFEGSLPAFLAAFSSRKNLSKSEIDEIRKMIDSYKEA